MLPHFIRALVRRATWRGQIGEVKKDDPVLSHHIVVPITVTREDAVRLVVLTESTNLYVDDNQLNAPLNLLTFNMSSACMVR